MTLVLLTGWGLLLDPSTAAVVQLRFVTRDYYTIQIMSFGDLSKWDLSDYRCFVCYYSKMHFNQVWRTWKPFDLDQTRNIDANWIRITLSIRNYVENWSYHWCWTSIVVSATFSPGYIVRQNSVNDFKGAHEEWFSKNLLSSRNFVDKFAGNNFNATHGSIFNTMIYSSLQS